MRNRLLASVALCSVAVLAAGAPGIVRFSDSLTESQERVEHATLHQRSIALAHSLSDERGDMVEYVAGGRTDRKTAGATTTSNALRARVDRQIAEILASDAVTASVKQTLKQLPRTRQEVLTGEGTAYDAFQAYTTVIQELHDISRSVARGLPGEVEPGSTAAAAIATTESLPHLGRAVEQASATRGLLRGAFAGDGSQRTLTEAAVQARVREQAALADFEQMAGPAAGETYDKTVTGTDVGLAERFIEQLTDDRTLGPTDRALSAERVVSALSARIDRMRSVQSSLATAEVTRLEQQRDGDVTALELRIALIGACLLLAVGVGVHTARSLSRPLSVLRRGSQRLASSTEPADEEPVRFTGRNDEFAEVVRSLNELRVTAARLHTRATEAEAENASLVGIRDELTAERERFREECEVLRGRLEAAHGATHGTFVHLGLRTLGLVERQLSVIETMEAKEPDPDALATLFKLDHLATRVRRAGENLLLLAGAERAATHQAGPVPLLDVLRAAISEIERYERVHLASLPPHAQISGFAADDVSHLVAELLDNATAFSAPDAEVTLSAWMLENGEIMLSVQDEGIGVAVDRLTELNARLGDPEAQDAPGAEAGDGEGLGNGLYVVARLAARHGLRVQLREQKAGGIAAVAVLPRALLPDRPVPGVTGHAPASANSGTHLPGSVAEANSNAIPSRRVTAVPGRVHDTPSGPVEVHVAPAPAPGLPVRVPGAGPETTSWPTGSVPAAPPAQDDDSAAADTPTSPDRAELSDATAPHTGSEGSEAPTVAASGEVSEPGGGTTRGELPPSSEMPPESGTDAEADDATAPVPPIGGEYVAEQDADLSATESNGPLSEGHLEPATAEPSRAVPAARGGEFEGGVDRLVVGDAPDGDEPPEEGTARGDDVASVGRPTRVPGAAPAMDEPSAGLGQGSSGMAGTPSQEPEVPLEHAGRQAADVSEQSAEHQHASVADEDGHARRHEPVVTDKGLPKRTPRHVVEGAARPSKSGGATPEELRRRLGGFQRGARDGHRDAAAEVATQGAADRGGTDEEAQQ